MPGTRFLLLHDTANAVAIAIIAFRNIPQGFQAGCTAMIFRLLLLDRLIIAGQQLLFFTELFICSSRSAQSAVLNLDR